MATSQRLAIAHRYPHSREELDAVVRAGAGAIELDLQVRGDRVVVSHHLPFLQIPGWFEHDGRSFRWRGGRVGDPGLADVVAGLPPHLRVLLDPKEFRPGRRAALAEAVGRALAGTDRTRMRVSTGRPEERAAYRAHGIATWTTISDEAGLRRFLAEPDTASDGVSVRHTLLDAASTVGRLADLSGTVVAWTVDDPARARELLELGVDGVTTNSPPVLALVSRWTPSGDAAVDEA